MFLKECSRKNIISLNPTISFANFFFSHLITCTFATSIYSCKSSWKDATWCPIAYEPPFKLHKNYIFIYFGMPLKKDDICVFSSSFSSKLTLITSLSHICNYKPFCNWLCNYKSIILGAKKDNCIYNCKIDWFGHKLQTHGLD